MDISFNGKSADNAIEEIIKQCNNNDFNIEIKVKWESKNNILNIKNKLTAKKNNDIIIVKGRTQKNKIEVDLGE